MIKKKIGVIHGIAECKTCGKRWEGYKNAQAVAARHAEKYKHLVRGEVGLGYEYDGRANEC